MATADTPRRMYYRSNICLLCGFSFIERQVTDGEEIVIKHLNQKLKITDEKLDKIKSVLPDFEVESSVTESTNGVCVKCFRRIENVNKTRKDIENHTALLKQSRRTVEQSMLTLPSPRKHVVTKRLLRSPTTAQKPKEMKPFPTTVIRKKPLQLLPLQPLISNWEGRLPKNEPASPGVHPLPKFKARKAADPSKQPTRRSLAFSNPQTPGKENPDGDVEVTVWYPSGKKTTVIVDETHKKMCMTIARGSSVEKVVTEHIRIASPMDIVNACTKIVKEECQDLCKRESGSVLFEKGYDSIFQFSWEDLQKDLESRCPGLFSIIIAAVGDKPPQSQSKQFRHVMMTAAMALHGRHQEMSLIQYLTAFVMVHGGCTQRNIERLSQLGICVHPKAVPRKLLSWQINLDSEILSLRDSWAKGGNVKYQLVGDNWDKNIHPSYRTTERKTLSLHLFNVYAVVDRVIPSPLSSFSNVLDATDLDASQFIPSQQEQVQLMQELTFIFATSVINNIPQLEKYLKRIYPNHLEHPYSSSAGEKTKQYSLGLFDCNENLIPEIISLLANSLEKYVPMTDGDIIESVFLGDKLDKCDRLTDQRVQGAQNAMRNAPTSKEKLEGFISKTEDFHRLMNFLEAVTKLTYSTKSAGDRGTMYYYRNLLNARNVKGKVKNAYRPYKILYYTVLDALCLVLFLHHFDITDFDGEIPLPDGFVEMSNKDKIQWMNDTCTTILRKWFFDSSDDIFKYLREVVSDKNHPENYWLAKLDSDTGRVSCHFCDKSYAYVGSLMSHEKKLI